jgi:hypothetical protein
MAPLLTSDFVANDKLTGWVPGPVLSPHAAAPTIALSVRPVFQNFVMMQLLREVERTLAPMLPVYT